MTVLLAVLGILALLAAALLVVDGWIRGRRGGSDRRGDVNDRGEIEREVYQRLYGDLRRQRLVLERKPRRGSQEQGAGPDGPSAVGDGQSQERRGRGARPRSPEPALAESAAAEAE